MTLWQRVYNERRTIVVPLLVLLAANVAVFLVGVLPLTRSVAGHEDAAIAARADLAEALRHDKQAKEAQASKDRAEKELTKFYADILPRSHQSGIRLINSWLFQTAVESGIRFGSGTVEPETVRDSHLMRLKATVSLEGQYANIRRFLYAVETAEEFVIVEKVELSETGVSQAQLTQGSLALNLNVTTYFVTKAPAP
jgi:Tfp pilus assembly protein PilO